jgi:hypothetical protein
MHRPEILENIDSLKGNGEGFFVISDLIVLGCVGAIEADRD